jgi:hypothetical protein
MSEIVGAGIMADGASMKLHRLERRRGVLAGLLLIVAGPLVAEEELAARVKRAQAAVHANTATPAGREWMKRNAPATDKVMLELADKCLPDVPDDVPTMFSVYVRLSRSGRAREVLTELDAALGRCMTAAARDAAFPEPPHDDYWIQVNMAAPL